MSCLVAPQLLWLCDGVFPESLRERDGSRVSENAAKVTRFVTVQPLFFSKCCLEFCQTFIQFPTIRLFFGDVACSFSTVTQFV